MEIHGPALVCPASDMALAIERLAIPLIYTAKQGQDDHRGGFGIGIEDGIEEFPSRYHTCLSIIACTPALPLHFARGPVELRFLCTSQCQDFGVRQGLGKAVIYRSIIWASK